MEEIEEDPCSLSAISGKRDWSPLKGLKTIPSPIQVLVNPSTIPSPQIETSTPNMTLIASARSLLCIILSIYVKINPRNRSSPVRWKKWIQTNNHPWEGTDCHLEETRVPIWGSQTIAIPFLASGELEPNPEPPPECRRSISAQNQDHPFENWRKYL